MAANIDDALEIVVKNFRGVTDSDGEPYIMHCLRVMLGVSHPLARQIAVMHDLVEDTEVTLEDLKEMGFSSEVVEAVDLVTHKQVDSYAAYVVRLKQNDLAREVKLSDLRDNSAIGRVLYREDRSQGDVQRMEKYALSYQFLSDRVDEANYRRRMATIEQA